MAFPDPVILKDTDPPVGAPTINAESSFQKRDWGNYSALVTNPSDSFSMLVKHQDMKNRFKRPVTSSLVSLSKLEVPIVLEGTPNPRDLEVNLTIRRSPNVWTEDQIKSVIKYLFDFVLGKDGANITNLSRIINLEV
jgi:hypothetical protein